MKTSALFNKTTSVLRRLNILCIIFKIIAIFLIELFTRLAFYLRGKNLHSHIISLREEVWAHITCIASPLFIDVHIPSHGSERSSMCVRSINVVFIYGFNIWFWNCFVFQFIAYYIFIIARYTTHLRLGIWSLFCQWGGIQQSRQLYLSSTQHTTHTTSVNMEPIIYIYTLNK